MRRTTSPAALATAALATLAALLLAAVVDSARRAYGMPFPSAMVTADGRFAAVFLPEWGIARAPLGHGDPIVAIDGVAVEPRDDELPGRAVYRLVARRHAQGHESATIEYVQSGVRQRLTLPIRTVGVRELWFFTVLMPLAGSIYLASGLLVHRLAGAHLAGRAYLLWCGAMFVALATTFDYLTVARLQPLFPVSVFLISLACVGLAYAFPAPPSGARLSRTMQALLAALVAAVAWVAIASMGADQRMMRQITNTAGFASLVVLGVTLAFRFGPTTRAAHAPIFAIAWILALVPVFWGSLLVGLARGEDALHMLAPFVFLAVPLAVDYAVLRHNLLDVPEERVRSMLTRYAVLWALLLGSAVAWSMYATALTPRASVAVPALVGAAVVVAMLTFSPRVFKGLYFSATARFRPTVEQLGDALATLTDRAAVQAALEEHVTRMVTTHGVRVLAPDALHTLRPDERAELHAGRHLLRWGDGERGLLVPMRCRGELQGVLCVPERPESPHTRDDLALLGTVASLGALALRHAAVVGELDALRREEVHATRDDRDLALGLLSAEVCHEVAYSLNYFRFLLRRVSTGNALGDKDVELGREEIDRLERMLSSLRRVEVAQPARVEVLLADPVERALGLLRDQARERRVEVDVPASLTVAADHDALVQVFANLLRNALQASEDGRVGVRAVADGDALTIDVWDTGPGVPPEFAARIFTPWVTTKKQGLGLGLAITERLVRSLGWTIALLREDGRTVFRLRAPEAACDDAREMPGETP